MCAHGRQSSFKCLSPGTKTWNEPGNVNRLLSAVTQAHRQFLATLNAATAKNNQRTEWDQALLIDSGQNICEAVSAIPSRSCYRFQTGCKNKCFTEWAQCMVGRCGLSQCQPLDGHGGPFLSLSLFFFIERTIYGIAGARRQLIHGAVVGRFWWLECEGAICGPRCR